MDSESDKFVTVQDIQSRRANSCNELRRHAMNAESNQFVAFGHVDTRRANARDKLGRHTMNLESNELIRVQPLQVLGFDVPCEFQADIVNSHRPLFIAIDSFESQRLHLLRILLVRREMK